MKQGKSPVTTSMGEEETKIRCPYCGYSQSVRLSKVVEVEDCVSCEATFVTETKKQVYWTTRKIEGEE